MVFLSHVRSDAESIRSSFCSPSSLIDAEFSITVDEPVGGPIVIRAEGTVDEAAVSALVDVLDEGVRSGRPLVVDVVDALDIDASILSALADTVSRLPDPRASLTVACTENFTSRLADARIDVQSHPTVAEAVTAGVASSHSGSERSPDEPVRTRPAVTLEGCSHALQGTYL